MSSRHSVTTAVALCASFILFVTLPAYAYIDPNAAVLLSQILIPLMLAAAADQTFFITRLGDLASISRRFNRGPHS